MTRHSSRKTKLVKGLQLRLIAAFLAMGVVALAFQAVFLERALVGLADEMHVDGEVLLASLPRMFATNTVLTLGILVPVMLVFGSMVTHRIAGPVRRFEHYLTDVVNDEAYGPCEIRRSDELQDLCTRLNEAIYHLSAKAERPVAAGPRSLPTEVEEDSPWVDVVDAAA